MMVLGFTVGWQGTHSWRRRTVLGLSRTQELDQLDGIVTVLGMFRDPGAGDVDMHPAISLIWPEHGDRKFGILGLQAAR